MLREVAHSAGRQPLTALVDGHCFGDVRERVDMKSKIATAVLIGMCVALAACNTVRGAAADVGSAANCTQDAMHGGRC